MTVSPGDKRYTYEDYLTWPEDERIEIIDGVVYMMTPPLRQHQKVSMELSRQLSIYLEGKRCEVYAAPFGVRLFEKADDHPKSMDTVVEPDLTIVCDPSKLDDHGCKGVPDMVIEILSPTTRRYDLMIKLNLYQRAGVREYWIVDPQTETVMVYLLNEHGSYQIHEVYGRTDVAKVNVLECCFIELSKVFPAEGD